MGTRRVVRLLATAIALAAAVTACHQREQATDLHLVVDVPYDAPDHDPGDGVCLALLQPATVSGGWGNTTGPVVNGHHTGCTLRAAIDETNATDPATTVTIELTTDVGLTLPGGGEDANATGDLDIQRSLTIAGHDHTIDANRIDRVVHHHDGDLDLEDLTIRGGSTSQSDGNARGTGAGIRLERGTLTATATRITDNVSSGGASALYSSGASSVRLVDTEIFDNRTDYDDALYWGSAIVSFDDLIIQQSSIRSNASITGTAGIVVIFADLRIEDSVISGNTTASCDIWYCPPSAINVAEGEIFVLHRSHLWGNSGPDGVIYASEQHVLIEESVIAGNHHNGAGIGDPHADGGVIQMQGPSNDLLLRSTVMVDNSDPNGYDVHSRPLGGHEPTGTHAIIESVLSQGVRRNNEHHGTPVPLVSVSVLLDPLCEFTSAGHNFFASPDCAAHPTDLIGTDPLLGPLQDNGGPTHSMLPLPGSPLLDAIPWGTADVCDTAGTDQRGLPRPATPTTACDIGPTERQPTD